MLREKVIIVFSDDWGRHPSSCQHIVRHFLDDNRVIWVNTIGIRSPQLTMYDAKRSIEKIRSWIRQPEKHDEAEPEKNLLIISPFIVPYNQVNAVRRLNKRSMVGKIKGLMEELGADQPVVITTFPNTADLVGALGESVHIYYCVDDFTQWPGANRELVEAMEDKLIDQCDLVFASAEKLCSVKTRRGKRPELLAHGVDFEHFNAGIEHKKAIPGLPDGTSPVIGFFGAVSPWIDFDLVAKAAKTRPDWSFVFIGPVDTDISALTGIPNIVFCGKVSYRELPGYAASFDVGIIPFLVNDLTISVNPLKLLEYLACGLPVVSTDLPEVRRFSEVVHIASGVENFIAGVEQSLAEKSPDSRRKRVELARTHSWKSVAEKLSFHIDDFFASGKVMRRGGETV